MTKKIYEVPHGRPNKGSRIIVLQRRRNVANLYSKGLNQFDIADELGMSQPVVSMDLTAIRKQWRKEYLTDFNEVQARVVAGIWHDLKEATEAWERSKKDAEILRVKTESGSGDDKSTKEKTVKGQVGDPRFLEVADKCREKLCKIFGFYQDINITQNTVQINWDALSEEVPDVIEAELLKVTNEVTGR